MKKTLTIIGLAAIAACGPAERADEASGNAAAESGKVTTSGKEEQQLADVPPDVLAAARAAQPDMRFAEAEAEVREGRNYYDVGGTLPDGSEIELDLMQDKDGWKVVETQRDIAFAAAPEAVRAVSAKHDPAFAPVRVIESRQSDALVIYELFGPAERGGEGRKVEIKYDGKTAELLTKEWAH